MNKKLYLPLIIVVLVTLSLYVFGRDERKPVAQAWEYKSVFIARGASSNGEFSIWYESTGTAVNPLPAPVSMVAKMQELGMQGWELVGVVPVSSHVGSDVAGFTSQISYFFKRPK